MSAAFRSSRRVSAITLLAATAILGGSVNGLLGLCGPFTDVSDAAFCPFVLEIFTLGITTGTSPTTYDPTSSVSRLQMAAFLSRTVDGVLRRGSRRAALDRFWTPQNSLSLGLTTVGVSPWSVKSDGADVWVANNVPETVSRVRASDGKLLETWTGAGHAISVLVAMGRVFIGGNTNPGNLYRIDPAQTAGSVTTLASNVGEYPQSAIAFDGARIWTGNFESVSVITPGGSIPWTVTTVTTGFGNVNGMLYDGANIWATIDETQRLVKLDTAAAILQTVTVGSRPQRPVFDGSNIWVANRDANSVSVVRASSGVVLATLTGNGLSGPIAAAFDGQRVLITDVVGHGVSLWKAADLTTLGFFPSGAGTTPTAACSDGVNFWITLDLPAKLARF